MRPTGTHRSATGLLVLGGFVFVFLGVRTLAGESRDRQQQAERRTHAAVLRAKADATRLARAPRGRPAAQWRLEPLAAESTVVAAHNPHLDDLRRAAAREPSPHVALPLYDALLRPELPRWVRDIASLRKALLLRTLDRGPEAAALLRQAAEASPFLVDTTSTRVRARALAVLAADALARGDEEPLATFLDAAEDGVRLVIGGAGPASELVELNERVAAGALPAPRGPLGERLAQAGARAAQGMRLAEETLAGDGVVVVAGRLAWRQGTQLALFELGSLLEAPLGGYEPSVAVEALEAAAPMPAGAIRLDAPLAGLVVRPLPAPDGGGILLLALAFASGLALYVIGAGVALAGWRRSRRAEQQQADFTAAVSHEMKTPIASVRAMAELLADGGAEDPELTKRYAQRIGSEMERLGTTVRNVLDAAHVERGALPVRPEPGDPAAVLERVADVVRPGLRARGFDFEVEAARASAPIPLDAGALEGVLMNLLDNAIKFSPEVRDIRLRGEPVVGGGYRIEVLDRGIGLGSGDAERLFERFHRGDAARSGAFPGVGLGLTIARQVVEAHGGRLRARGRPEGGSAFEIDLPGEPAR